MKFKLLEFMLYQENTSRKQPTTEFFGTGTQQEQRFMPLAPFFKYTQIMRLFLINLIFSIIIKLHISEQ